MEVVELRTHARDLAARHGFASWRALRGHALAGKLSEARLNEALTDAELTTIPAPKPERRRAIAAPMP